MKPVIGSVHFCIPKMHLMEGLINHIFLQDMHAKNTFVTPYSNSTTHLFLSSICSVFILTKFYLDQPVYNKVDKAELNDEVNHVSDRGKGKDYIFTIEWHSTLKTVVTPFGKK